MTLVIIPLVSGKWCRVERYYVPETYIQALLASMPNDFSVTQYEIGARPGR